MAVPNAAIVFDIDGVLVHGPKPVPGAREALQRVVNARVPHVFVTNNGQQDEIARSARLQRVLDLPVDPARMILCQTPLKDEAASFGDSLVLVTGTSLHPNGCVGLLKGLGFRNTMSTTDFAACHPQLMPNKKRDEKFSPPPAPAQRVAAVVIVETPEDWFEDLQVLCDVLQTDGRLGCRAAEGRQPVRLIVCNEDFTFAWADVPPRFGPGAFVTCLEALYTRMTGRQLQYDTYGKPHAPAYSFAQRQLALQLFPGADIDSADRAALPDGMTVYAIGDNPTSDIRGANAAGNQWRSILVRTGVFDSEKENDPLDPADHVVDDVCAAVERIFELEGIVDAVGG